MAIKQASGLGRPKFKMPKVKTTFNKRGYLQKSMRAKNRRIGAR